MLGWAIVAQGGRWRANTGTKVTRTQSPIILDHIYITQPALEYWGHEQLCHYCYP